MDPIDVFKDRQRKAWSSFAPFENFTAVAAPRLVRFAGVASGHRVLDVGCGTGVAAITAARAGAKVTGVDLTPELIERARENVTIAGTPIDLHIGDVEELPFANDSFDIVMSQFGHMFAPRPEIALAEMLRVLRPGGTIAFSTWPPELYTGRMFLLVGSYLPLPPNIPPPVLWGDPAVIRTRLGTAVTDLEFERPTAFFPAVSPPHVRLFMEQNAGPVITLVNALAEQPDKLAQFRREFDQLVAKFFENNAVRQGFLITRALKV